MALDKKKLVPVGKVQGVIGMFLYHGGADAAATGEGAGYFGTAAGVSDLMESGDILIARWSDATKIYKLTVSGTTVTLSTGTAIS